MMERKSQLSLGKVEEEVETVVEGMTEIKTTAENEITTTVDVEVIHAIVALRNDKGL